MFHRSKSSAGSAPTLEDCYRDPWIRTRLGRWWVPVFPVWPFRAAIVLHDLHHVVTGYSTTWEGETEVAAWEISSGGCGWQPYFWAHSGNLAITDSPTGYYANNSFSPLTCIRIFDLSGYSSASLSFYLSVYIRK